MKNGARVLQCAGGCEKKIRVGMGIVWVICGDCTHRLGSVWHRIEAKQKRTA